MRALAYFIQFLVVLLVVRLVLRGLARLMLLGGVRAARAAAAPSRPEGFGEDLVLDRVCRIHVPRSRALTARLAGREEHFCSAACRDKALAEVARAS